MAEARPSPAWAFSALLAVLGGALGCAEPPSYELRWKLVEEAAIDDPDAAPDLTSVTQCSAVGVSKVRVTTRRLDNSVADRREYPCFPGAFERDAFVEGPTLEPGEYKLEVEGLRRTGEPWACVDDPDTPEPEPCVAFAEGSVTVAEGALPSVEFVLLAPPECDDGIDNDRDGRVDGQDPACLLAPEGPEAADASLTLFQLAVTFLNSDAVFPEDVSVDYIRVMIDDEVLADVPVFELDVSQWPYRLPLLSEGLDAGTYEITIAALGSDLEPATVALPVETLEVLDNEASFAAGEFDFGGADFLEPIVDPFSVIVSLLDDETGTSSICSFGSDFGSGDTAIDSVRLRVSDGAALDAATLALTGPGGAALEVVDEANGWVSLPCPAAAVRSAELPWDGVYTIEIEARVADEVCFATDGPQDLAPLGQGGPQNFYLAQIGCDG